MVKYPRCACVQYGLSHTDTKWPTLAHCVPHWRSVSHTGALCPTLTLSDPHWHTVSHTGTLCPTLGRCVPHWRSVSHTGNQWPTLGESTTFYKARFFTYIFFLTSDRRPSTVNRGLRNSDACTCSRACACAVCCDTSVQSLVPSCTPCDCLPPSGN